MDIFSTFATDEVLEAEGKWHNLSKTAKIKVARSGNEKYIKALRSKMAEAQLDLVTGEDGNKLAEELLIDVMAETLLVGWEGVSFKGEALTYSRDNARKLLGIKDFRKKVSDLADNFEAFKVKAEVEQKND